MKRLKAELEYDRPSKQQKVCGEGSKSPSEPAAENENNPNFMAVTVTRNTLLTEKISLLTKQVESLSKEKEYLADMNSDLIKKNDALEAYNNTFVERLNSKIAEIRRMQSAILQMKEKEIRDLESKREGLRKGARMHAEEIKKTRKENQRLHKEIVKVRNDIGRANVEEASMRRKLLKKDKEIKGLVAELSEESKQKAQLWSDLEKKREEVTRLNKRIEKADDEYRELRDKCEKNAKDLYKLSKKCAKRQSKICKLSDDNERKNAEVTTLSKTTEAQCLELTALRSKLAALEGSRNEPQAGADGITKELSRLRRESQERDAEISWMTREAEIRKDEISRLKTLLSEKEQEVDGLKKKLKTVKNKRNTTRIEVIQTPELKSVDDVVQVMGFNLPRRKPLNLELIDETIKEVRKMENLLQETRSVLVERKLECPICKDKEKDRVLNCGHMYCRKCIEQLPNCPTCNKVIIDIRTLFF